MEKAVPAVQALPEALYYHARLRPDSPALIAPGAAGQPDIVVTYTECAARMDCYARALVGLGVKRGDRVAVRLQKSTEGILLFLAVNRVGALYVPINPDFTAREAEVLIEDSEPILLIDNAADELKVPEGRAVRIVSFGTGAHNDLLDCNDEGALPDLGPNDAAVMLFTSGTTGRPKGAPLTQANLLSNMTALAETWEFSEADRLLHVLPVFHGHGLFLGIAMPLMVGASVILLPKFDAAEAVRLLAQASVLMAVPSIYTRLLDRPEFKPEACKTLRLATSGSAPLSPELFNALRERMGITVVERYGLTETCILTSNPINGAARVGSVGLPLPCIELRIAGSDGTAARTGDVGGVQVRGDCIIDGYWRQAEKGSDWTGDGWFETGDMGQLDKDGYLWLVGRKKDLIISGGYNVYPREVEIQIEAQSGVSEAVVFGVPHPDFGEGVMAAVRTEAGNSVDVSEIETGLAEALSKYKRPKRIVLMKDFPRNAMGKVLKTELRRVYADAFARGN